MRWTFPFFRTLRRFQSDESGATTVDWVVLTAAIVGLAVAVIFVFANESDSYASRVGDHMSSMGIATY